MSWRTSDNSPSLDHHQHQAVNDLPRDISAANFASRPRLSSAIALTGELALESALSSSSPSRNSSRQTTSDFSPDRSPSSDFLRVADPVADVVEALAPVDPVDDGLHLPERHTLRRTRRRRTRGKSTSGRASGPTADRAIAARGVGGERGGRGDAPRSSYVLRRFGRHVLRGAIPGGRILAVADLRTDSGFESTRLVIHCPSDLQAPVDRDSRGLGPGGRQTRLRASSGRADGCPGRPRPRPLLSETAQRATLPPRRASLEVAASFLVSARRPRLSAPRSTSASCGLDRDHHVCCRTTSADDHGLTSFP